MADQEALEMDDILEKITFYCLDQAQTKLSAGEECTPFTVVVEGDQMFEENFPFPLGGDDLDLSYRITKTGYLIKSCPEAVAFHSTETWNNPKAIQNRTRRWGAMEYYISQRHPEIFINCIPKSGILFLFDSIIGIASTIMVKNSLPLLLIGIWLLVHYISVYIYDCIHKDGGNPLYYLLGKSIRCIYRFFYHIESLKHGNFTSIHKEMSFSIEQTKFMQKRESAVFIIYLLSFVVVFFTFFLFCGGRR